MGAKNKTQPLRGIVLMARNVGESDRVYDLLAERQGIVTLWHPGARRPRRGRAASLTPFASYDVLARERKEGFGLIEAAAVAERSALRTSLAALARASQLAHLVRSAWPMSEPADEVLSLLGFALDCLARHEVPRAAGCYPHLIRAAGLMPSLAACGLCRRPFTAPPAVVLQQTLACAVCAGATEPLSLPLWQALGGRRIDSEAVAAALESQATAWFSHHVGRDLRLPNWGTGLGPA